MLQKIIFKEVPRTLVDYKTYEINRKNWRTLITFLTSILILLHI